MLIIYNFITILKKMKGSSPQRSMLFRLTTAILSARAAQASRLRIRDYVGAGQQFLVMDPLIDETVALYEDPSADMVLLKHIFWFCSPQHAPDQNGDGEFDNVLGHALTFRFEETVEEQMEDGASIHGSWSPHGYVATWTGDSYDEKLIDYDDHTVIQLSDILTAGNRTEGGETISTLSRNTRPNMATITGFESSGAVDTGGVVLAGSGEWISDTTDPRLVAMAHALGRELTPQSCAEQYEQVWEQSHSEMSSSSCPRRGVRGSTLTLLVSAVWGIYSLLVTAPMLP